jgi:hypothetical protein
MESKSSIENAPNALSERPSLSSTTVPQDSVSEHPPMDVGERRLDYIPISAALIEHVRRIDGFNVSATTKLMIC